MNFLDTGHSVLVAAHTSAGKTVVAEYAFAMAIRWEFVDLHYASKIVSLWTSKIFPSIQANLSFHILFEILCSGWEPIFWNAAIMIFQSTACFSADESSIREAILGILWKQ